MMLMMMQPPWARSNEPALMRVKLVTSLPERSTMRSTAPNMFL